MKTWKLDRSPFASQSRTDEIKNVIPVGCDIVIVADMFASDYAGGAELTTQALIDSSQFDITLVRSADVTLDLLESGHDKFWIFGNYAAMDLSLIPTIVGNMRYSIIEYDYKYCRHRSPEKHVELERVPCHCDEETHGKLVSAFMYGARSLWWMSERQQRRYHDLFPFLVERPSTVLSSVFDDASLAALKILRHDARNAKRNGWIVLGSPSWIKGADDAMQWCEKNGKSADVVWNVPYENVLARLSHAEGHVYLPRGGDTCPRMVIEAKLLGCQLHINDNVEHAKEEWFATDDLELTASYLYASRTRFWNGTKHDMGYHPSLSGYTTTRNSVRQSYPFKESIESMLGFCDEVVVVDACSDDGTWEILREMAARDGRIKTSQLELDWSDARFGLYDGMLKAEARRKCLGKFCWQQDTDEIVSPDDCDKIRKLVFDFSSHYMLALPVIEYWGSLEKVRVDVNPWKWRLSRNLPIITHGVPVSMRRFDASGKMFSAGSDGCDLIHAETGEPIPFLTFYTYDIEEMRLRALNGDRDALRKYSAWLNDVVKNLPSVFHFSWLDIARKIRLYRDYWQAHWSSLFGHTVGDVADDNMFFSKRWEDVSDAEIDALADRLAREMGGWIFHRRVDFSRPTPWISCQRKSPLLPKEDPDAA